MPGHASHRSVRVGGAATVGLLLGSLALSTIGAASSSASLSASLSASRSVVGSTAAVASPIKHVVIIYQENHSFDNVLGKLCATEARSVPCDGATSGHVESGSTVPLQKAPDIVPLSNHDTASQAAAVNGGKMDSFDKVKDCTWDQFAPPPGDVAPYSDCYTQYAPGQIPSLSALARKYAISDRTFEEDKVPSWGGHLELALAGLGGFTGDNPTPDKTVVTNPGWGCDSNRRARWSPDGGVTPYSWQPSCIPYPGLDPTRFPFGGAYKQSAVPYQRTMMDEALGAGLSMHIYAELPPATTPGPQPPTATQPAAGGAAGNALAPAAGGQVHPNGYAWSICPSFAKCLYTAQRGQIFTPKKQLDTDAAAGTLPAISYVMPMGVGGNTSQHNQQSMLIGDNRIGQVVSEIENGPAGPSTAIFITYDDCGCFADHVAPPAGTSLGIRVPMVIVSPYAKAGFTDHTVASYASMLAFIEHNFGLPPLSSADATAYDYADAFDYTQVPLAAETLTQHPIPADSQRFLLSNPDVAVDDPT